MLRSTDLLATLTVFVVAWLGCTGVKTVERKQPCPETGTVVLFSKVMNPAFAPHYVGFDISTEVQFVATGQGAWASTTLKQEGYVVFRALPPGQEGEKNPFSGETQAHFIMIPTQASESVFAAKVGDILVVRGGTIVNEMVGFTEVVFRAQSVKPK